MRSKAFIGHYKNGRTRLTKECEIRSLSMLIFERNFFNKKIIRSA